jgi:putative tryptophan/tyrosine transport system substrate-binding protein
MKRRDFITLLGGSAAWPVVAWAQQAGKVPIIGYLGTSTSSSMSQRTAAFVQRLRELGWVEGRDIRIEYRWAEGRAERYNDIAAEFVRLKVDVIVTSTTAPVLAAKEATSTIPIVFAISADPVGTKLVKNLARPGSNVTGLSIQTTDIAGKRLELLRDVVPNLRRLAILTDIEVSGAVLENQEVRGAAATLGLDVIPVDIRGAQDIATAFDAIGGRADALYVSAAPSVFSNRIRLNTMALGARLPTFHANREYVQAGGLMSYGPDILERYTRAGDYVDKILRGTKPGDIPVEQPTKFELIVNLTTAKALGLTVPPALLARADEVIE